MCLREAKSAFELFQNMTPQILFSFACQAMFDRLVALIIASCQTFILLLSNLENLNILAPSNIQQGVRACTLAMTSLLRKK